VADTGLTGIRAFFVCAEHDEPTLGSARGASCFFQADEIGVSRTTAKVVTARLSSQRLSPGMPALPGVHAGL